MSEFKIGETFKQANRTRKQIVAHMTRDTYLVAPTRIIKDWLPLHRTHLMALSVAEVTQ